jgi:hypothetical protein
MVWVGFIASKIHLITSQILSHEKNDIELYSRKPICSLLGDGPVLLYSIKHIPSS